MLQIICILEVSWTCARTQVQYYAVCAVLSCACCQFAPNFIVCSTFYMRELQENVCVESVGYLLEELRNPATLAAFKADVEDANIFIGSLIFVQELAEKVVEVVEPLREKLDAVLIFPSMPDVMRLNKVCV